MPEPFDVERLNTRHKCPMLLLVGAQDWQVPSGAVRVGYTSSSAKATPSSCESSKASATAGRARRTSAYGSISSSIDCRRRWRSKALGLNRYLLAVGQARL